MPPGYMDRNMFRKIVEKIIGHRISPKEEVFSKVEHQNLNYETTFHLTIFDKKSDENQLYLRFDCSPEDFRPRFFDVFIEGERVNQYVLNRPDHGFLIPIRTNEADVEVCLKVETLAEDGENISEKIALSEIAILTDRIPFNPTHMTIELNATGYMYPPFTRIHPHVAENEHDYIQSDHLDAILPICRDAQELYLYCADNAEVLSPLRRILDEIDNSFVNVHMCMYGIPVDKEFITTIIKERVRSLTLSLDSVFTPDTRRISRMDYHTIAILSVLNTVQKTVKCFLAGIMAWFLSSPVKLIRSHQEQ